jgi:pSer/pThr/pTyr-binding forkhead associated (FHA) protein
MGVRLTVKMKSEASSADKARVVTLDDEVINLGRDQSCQVVLAQMAVSRNHARISRDGALFFIEDLGSSYGTHVNGERLPKSEKRLLRNGDVIAIAQFDVTFDRVTDLSPEAFSGKTQIASRRAVKIVMKGLGARDNSYLRIMNGPKEGQHIELNEGQEYVFGRDEESADIVLTDDLVSRRHAKVRRDWSGVTLEDLKSRNGVKLNHKRVTRSTLKDRDELEIGGVRLLFVDPAEARDEPLVMAAADEAEPTLGLKEEAPEPVASAQPDPDPALAEPQGEVEPTPEEPASEEPPPEGEPMEELPANPSKLFDLSNKRSLVALAFGGTLILIALIILIMLLAGA